MGALDLSEHPMNMIFWIREILYRHYQRLKSEEAEKLKGKELKKKKPAKAAAQDLAGLIAAAGREHGLKRTVEARWLMKFLRDYDGSEESEEGRYRRPEYGVHFDLGLLELLHCYLAKHGYPLDTRPIFSPIGLLTPLAASKNVALLMAVKPTEGFRNDIIAWDNKSMAVLWESLRKAGFSGDFKIQEVPLLAKPTAQVVEDEEWFPLLSDTRTSLIAIGSPRASHASEWLLSRMFERTPFEAASVHLGEPVGVPFCFAWPRLEGGPVRSCCGLSDADLDEFRNSGVAWARDVSAGKASAIFLNAHYLAPWYLKRGDRKDGWVPVARIPPPRREPWEMFATVVAQRRKEGQIWVVISGISGPATMAASMILDRIDAALPTSTRENGKVMWGVVKTLVITKKVPHAGGTVGDYRDLPKDEKSRDFIVDLQEWPPPTPPTGL